MYQVVVDFTDGEKALVNLKSFPRAVHTFNDLVKQYSDANDELLPGVSRMHLSDIRVGRELLVWGQAPSERRGQ